MTTADWIAIGVAAFAFAGIGGYWIWRQLKVTKAPPPCDGNGDFLKPYALKGQCRDGACGRRTGNPPSSPRGPPG